MLVEQMQKKYLNFWVHLTHCLFWYVPPRFLKIVAKVLCQLLSNAIKNRLTKDIFQTMLILSWFYHLTKVLLIRTIYRIFNQLRKLRIRSHLMKKFLLETFAKISSFISAYRQNYSAQQVLICLPEEWREGLQNCFVVGGVFMDISKTFDWIPYDLLIANLKAYGFDEYLVHHFYFFP